MLLAFTVNRTNLAYTDQCVCINSCACRQCTRLSIYSCIRAYIPINHNTSFTSSTVDIAVVSAQFSAAS